jgi:tetratricopeptide (TPR) repeat protein
MRLVSKRLLLGALLLLVTATLLAAPEFLLRVAGYGEDTRFLLERPVNGVPYYVVNPGFYQQFLSMPVGNIVDLDDLGFQVPCAKAPGTVRILIFGDSAVHGCTPDSAFGLARFLAVFLRHQFPDTPFEICNAACPALNSHVMRLAAQACEQLQPDLVLVYMGNNEFIGPFGPGVTGSEVVTAAFVDRWVAWRKLRLVQILSRGSARWLPGENKGGGIFSAFLRFRSDGPERASMRTRYRENVEAIGNAAREAGARVLLCTVASNLLAWEPFASLHRPDLPPEALAEWNRHYEAGQAREAAGDLAGALDSYQQAAQRDDSFAQLEYRLGRVLAAMDKPGEARVHLERARDRDAMPLRVDSEMNDALRSLAERSGQSLVDVERLLQSEAPGAMPDNTLFWDFVHFNFHGAYLAARAMFEAVVPLMASGKSAAPLSEQECADRLGYTPAVRLTHAKRLAPAFTFWGVPEENTRWLQGIEEELEKTVGPDAPSLELSGYRQAAALCPTDYRVRQRYAQHLLQQGDARQALDLAQALVNDFPWRRGGYLLAAAAAKQQGQRTQALQFLERMAQVFPDAPANLDQLAP